MKKNDNFNNEQYQSILASGQGELIYLLYKECLKEVRLAEKSIASNNFSDTNYYMIRAQIMIDELMCSLNFEYDIAYQLYNIYEYINRILVNANVNKNGEELKSVLFLLESLVMTWEAVIHINHKNISKNQSEYH